MPRLLNGGAGASRPLDRRLTGSSQAIIRKRSRGAGLATAQGAQCSSRNQARMSKPPRDRATLHPMTRLVSAGRDKAFTGPFVNPPVVHASTVLFDSIDAMLDRSAKYTYGRRGTPTMEALETAIRELEGAAGTVICPSGLSAATTALLSCLRSGDHVLIVDCVYGPTRQFAEAVLKRLGVEVTFFEPGVGAGIAGLFTERTRAVYLESPGSLTFEMQDVPAIAAVAKERGATTILDNTWAT